MHLKTFYWQLDTRAIEYWQYAAVAGGICGLPLVPILNRLIDKKWTVIIGITGSAVAGTLPVILKLFDLMPTDHDVLVPLLIVLAMIGSVCGIQAAVTVASMMGDIADEHELHHGTRQEGIYFGSFNFSSKCTSAAGNLVAGFTLDFIHFPANSTPGLVAEEVLFKFGSVYGAVLVMLAFSTWFFWPYALDKHRHKEIVRQLEKRNQPDADVRTAA